MAYHDLDDVQHWLASKSRAEFFETFGVTDIRTFTDPQGSSRVGLLIDVPDMDAVMAAVQSPAGAEAMARDGVQPESLVILVAS
jgi:hypothetical protein